MGMLVNPFAVAAGTDPEFDSVVQLAHFNGANGSTTYTNSCSRGGTLANITAGWAEISTTQSVFGGSSLKHLNNGGGIEVPGGHSDYTFGTSDFCVEFRVRLPTGFAALAPWIYATLPSGFPGPHFIIIAATNLVLNANGANQIIGSTVLPANTWFAVAYARVAGTGRLLLDGTVEGSWADTINYSTVDNTYIPGWQATGVTADYYDELRVTNGAVGSAPNPGRYTGNYTVAAAPFPNS